MAPTSGSSSIDYFTNSYAYRLLLHSPFHMGSVPSSIGVKCISPSFLFGGTYFGSYPGSTLQYLPSKSCSVP